MQGLTNRSIGLLERILEMRQRQKVMQERAREARSEAALFRWHFG